MPPQETEPKEVIIAASKGNYASFIVFIICGLGGGTLFTFLYGFHQLYQGVVIFLTQYIWLLITITSGILTHELLHAAAFALAAPRGVRSVRFGIDLRSLAPYVHCSDDVSFTAFAVATLLPGIVLGFLPLVISLILGNAWLFTFACFFTAGAAGDFICFYYAIPYRGKRIMDHPASIGFLVK